MLVIPGHRCYTCEGPTRRELLRAGSIGLFGLNLAQFLAWQGAGERRQQQAGWLARIRQREIRDHGVPARRTQSHRYLGS